MISLGQLIVAGLPVVIEIVKQGMQTIPAVAPNVVTAFESWSTLIVSKMRGVAITEEQVKELQTKVFALSDENAAREDAIIAGKV